MKERRIGRFTVAEKLLRDAIDTGHGANLFHKAVPLDVNRDWMSGRTTFLCWHPEFRPINEGEIAPEYVAEWDAKSVYPVWRELKP